MTTIPTNDGHKLLCDLFYYIPNSHNNSLSMVFTDSMFEDMWNFNHEEFIYIIFYLRKHGKIIDEISGRGQRKIFHQAIIWLSYHKLPILIKILPQIPNYGYWKDLLVLMGTPAEPSVIKLFGDQLTLDYSSYHSPIPGLISMAAKWTPNEKSSSDIRHNTYGKIAQYMSISRKILRTHYLVPLRKYLSVTEQKVSTKQWSSINYHMVPQLSLKLHTNSFLQHDYHRFTDYLNNSYVDHMKKIILPTHVESLLTDKSPTFSHQSLNSPITPQLTIKAVDISGSMAGFPITLAACMCADNNDIVWIPFRFENTSPIDENILGFNLHIINGNTHSERINDIISSIEKDIPGYDLLTCIKLINNIFTYEMSIVHLIIMTNIPIDESEIPISEIKDDSLHITYWVINTNPVNIIDIKGVTIIEGYDINVYNNLRDGKILSRGCYKNIIIESVRKDNKLSLL